MKKDNKKDKRNYLGIEIFFGIVILIVGVLSFFEGIGITSITGYLSVNSYSQQLNLSIDRSQNYMLSSTNEQAFVLKSFKINGEVIGNGRVNVFLDNGRGQRLLVFENTRIKGGGLSGITGITGGAIGTDTNIGANKGDYIFLKPVDLNVKVNFAEFGSNEESYSGAFENECEESCYIEFQLGKDISYGLIFLIDKGTILKINELVYTIMTD